VTTTLFFTLHGQFFVLIHLKFGWNNIYSHSVVHYFFFFIHIINLYYLLLFYFIYQLFITMDFFWIRLHNIIIIAPTNIWTIHIIIVPWNKVKHLAVFHAVFTWKNENKKNIDYLLNVLNCGCYCISNT